MTDMSDANLITFHRKLLNASERMKAYQQAIIQTVKPGDVVIDVGCGSGILGLFACQAGARRVYAIERTAAITVAKQLAEANGFGDRIVYLNQEIKDVRLDEQADVIVSELISKAVIGQKMAETIGYCRDHLLKPNGRILPAEVDLLVAPVDDEQLYRKILLPGPDEYDLDFSIVAERSCNTPFSAHISAESLIANGQNAYHYQAITAANLDKFTARLLFATEKDRVVHGFALWFSSLLAEGIVLSNHPPGIAAWDNLFLPLETPVHVRPGMIIELTLQGRDDSQMPSTWKWDTVVRSGAEVTSRQQQSTFAAQLLSSNITQSYC